MKNTFVLDPSQGKILFMMLELTVKPVMYNSTILYVDKTENLSLVRSHIATNKIISITW